MIAERMGFDEDRIELVRLAGILHDVGKLGITDVILNKPEKLTSEEMGVIKAHPVLGRFILESIDALKRLRISSIITTSALTERGIPTG